MQMNRLFEMVYILLNKKQVTAKELSERFEVSTRTIYRDIESLCEAGVPIYTNKGKGGGISLLDNFVLNKSYLSANEQQEILAALQSLKVTPYTQPSEALGKLSALFGGEEVDWIEVDFGSWDQGEKEKFEIIKAAILDKRLLMFDYYNARMEKTNRKVEPLQLSFKERSWYLKGYCQVREEMRLFKLSRIKHIEKLEAHFERTLRQMNIQQKTPEENAYRSYQKVILRIAKSQAYRVFDEFSEESIKKCEDGSFIVEINYPEDEWLYGYLLSYGPHAEVLEPETVREEIKKRLAAAVTIYKI